MSYGAGQELWRALSGQSGARTARPSTPSSEDGYSSDERHEKPKKPILSKAESWTMMPEVKKFHDKQTKEHFKGRSLGVTWNNLTVKGISSDAAIHENVISQFNIPQIVREKLRGAPKKTILDSVHGCVKPGEMLLVLGRPGSGCSSLLKILANHREGYAEVNGEVNFGSMVSFSPLAKLLLLASESPTYYTRSETSSTCC